MLLVFGKNRDGTDELENVERKHGCLDPSFIKNHNLSTLSQPEDFMEVLFPYEKNTYSTTKKECLGFSQITKWINLKAVLAGAGHDGTVYKELTPFTVREARQHLGLYRFDGITPSRVLNSNLNHIKKTVSTTTSYLSFLWIESSALQ